MRSPCPSAQAITPMSDPGLLYELEYPYRVQIPSTGSIYTEEYTMSAGKYVLGDLDWTSINASLSCRVVDSSTYAPLGD